jgi:hypothetical protein
MIGKYLITITKIEDEPHSEVNYRNGRNKTNIEYFIRTRLTTIKRRIKLNRSYQNLPICSAGEFFDWSIRSKVLAKLFKAWNDSGHKYRLIPTIDRIDPKKGYTIDNIRWIVLHENSKRARKK